MVKIKPGGKVRDFAALEAGRLKAARLFAKGHSQAAARALGVSAMSEAEASPACSSDLIPSAGSG